MTHTGRAPEHREPSGCGGSPRRCVRLTHGLSARLRAEAERTGSTESAIIRAALRRHLSGRDRADEG